MTHLPPYYPLTSTNPPAAPTTDLRLLDRQGIADELGITLTSAERVMRHVPKIKIGRRVFVRRQDVADYISREASS